MAKAGWLLAGCVLASAGAWSSEPESNQDFQLMFSGTARLESFTYFHRGEDHFIDTTVALESEFFRYQKTYAMFEFEDETDMGRGPPDMPFDPNRGRWMFGLRTRTEFDHHFFEVILRHDCFHGIDRYYAGQDYKAASEGVGFGTLRYLEKYRFRGQERGDEGLSFPLELNYSVTPTVYYPNSTLWQRLPYRSRLEADLRLDLLRWRRLRLSVETNNVFYYSRSHDIQRQHVLEADLSLVGTGHAMSLFGRYWLYDDQVFRNRDGLGVIGLSVTL